MVGRRNLDLLSQPNRAGQSCGSMAHYFFALHNDFLVSAPIGRGRRELDEL